MEDASESRVCSTHLGTTPPGPLITNLRRSVRYVSLLCVVLSVLCARHVFPDSLRDEADRLSERAEELVSCHWQQDAFLMICESGFDAYGDCTYHPVWIFNVPEGEAPVLSFDVGDVDNDGQNEIVFTNTHCSDINSDGHIRVIEHLSRDDFGVVWETGFDEAIGKRNVAIGDCDNDGLNEFIIGGQFYFRGFKVYEHTGGNDYDEVCSISIGQDCNSVQIEDVNNDDENEILIGAGVWPPYNVFLYKCSDSCFYDIIWSHSFSNRIGYGPTLYAHSGDCDNDDLNEVVVSSVEHADVEEDSVFIFDWIHGDIFDLVFSEGGVYGYPVVGDLLNTGRNAVAFVCPKHESLFIYVHEDAGYRKAHSEYAEFAWEISVGNADNKGGLETVVGGRCLNIWEGGTVYELLETGTKRELRQSVMTKICTDTLELDGNRYLFITQMKISDVDNDGQNELLLAGYYTPIFEARDVWKKALELYQKTAGTEREQARCHIGIGRTLMFMETTEDCIAHQNLALKLLEEVQDAERERGDCYFNMGAANRWLERYEEGANSLEIAADLYRKTGRTDIDVAECHLHLAACYRQMGSKLGNLEMYERGIMCMQDALEVLSGMENMECEQATCYASIGAALGTLGMYEMSMENLEKALELWENMGNTNWTRALGFLTIGSTLWSLAGYEEYAEYSERVLELLGQIETTQREHALCRANIGNVLLHRRRFEECIEHEQEALSFYEKMHGTYPEQASCHHSIGEALLGLGRDEDGIARLERALELYSKSVGREGEQAQCFLSLALCYRRQGFDEALGRTAEAFRNAVICAETFRDKALAMEARMGLFARTASVYPNVVSFLLQCSETECVPRDSLFERWRSSSEADTASLEIAFHFAEAGKARTLIDLVSQRLPALKDSVAIGIYRQKAALVDEIGRLQTRLMCLGRIDEEKRAVIETEKQHKQMEMAQIDYKLKSTLIGRYTSPRFSRADEIQKKLDGEKAVLEYAVTDDETILLILTDSEIGGWRIDVKSDAPKRPQTHSFDSDSHLCEMFRDDPNSMGLTGLVTLYRHWMEAFSSEGWDRQISKKTHIEVGRYLCDLLLPEDAREMLERNGISRVIIVPDHCLHLLPFGALITESSNKEVPEDYSECRFFLQDYTMTYASSMALLDVIKEQRAEREAQRSCEQARMIAFGDPVFEDSDKRLKKGGAPEEETEVAQASFVRSYYEDTRMNLKRLQETEEEVLRIAELFPEHRVYRAPLSENTRLDGNTSVLLGLAASGDAVQLPQLKEYRYVHFATHGSANKDNPWFSCIALSGRPDQVDYHPYFLTTMDIFGLELDADLVTLSGCETGLGRRMSGEGMVGLTTGFFYAGASSVVVSLWPVPSKETVQLMESFYRHISEGRGKAEALRAAQMEMLDRGIADPTYWAAFVLHGESE